MEISNKGCYTYLPAREVRLQRSQTSPFPSPNFPGEIFSSPALRPLQSVQYTQTDKILLQEPESTARLYLRPFPSHSHAPILAPINESTTFLQGEANPHYLRTHTTSGVNPRVCANVEPPKAYLQSFTRKPIFGRGIRLRCWHRRALWRKTFW